MDQSTTAFNNTSVGFWSGRYLQTGSANVAIGFQALYGGSGNTATSNNTAVGYNSLYSITTGSNNTAVGYSTGSGVTTNTYNTFLGTNATASVGLNYATAIGADAVVTSSNTVLIGRVDNSTRVVIGQNAGVLQYRLYTYQQQLTADGDGQHVIYGYRTRDSQNDGTGYAMSTSNTAAAGYNHWGDIYTFGVGGYSYNDYTRTGGVLGAQVGGGYWGSLGYRSSGPINYGVYGSSAYANGAGFLQDGTEGYTGIGGGFYGGIIGAWSRGEVMGHLAAGELFASYNLGNEFTSGYQADLVSNGDKKTAAYSITSSDLKVYADGNASLNGNSVFVPFDASFKSLLGTTPNVTITPVGQAAQLYISAITKEGFTVASATAANVQFNWMAAATRVDADKVTKVPADVLQSTFDSNMKKVLFNEGNLEQSGTTIWHDGKQVRFDKAPEKKVERKTE